MTQQNNQQANQSGQRTDNESNNQNTGKTENHHSTLTTEGDATEQEENLGGTTNLSLDQLKKEGDPQGSHTNE
jgi:hypothetical protein